MTTIMNKVNDTETAGCITTPGKRNSLPAKYERNVVFSYCVYFVNAKKR